MSGRVTGRARACGIAGCSLAIAACVFLGAAGVGAAGESGPYRTSRACARDAVRRSGCHLVIFYFRAINAGRYGHACALLGEKLRLETGGTDCPRVLAFAGQQRFGILDAWRSGAEVGVVVALDLPELDHVRVLHWLALVGVEGGTLKILETRRIA
jgi:hypothetical protein